jgi:hypothetical protein
MEQAAAEAEQAEATAELAVLDLMAVLDCLHYQAVVLQQTAVQAAAEAAYALTTAMMAELAVLAVVVGF